MQKVDSDLMEDIEASKEDCNQFLRLRQHIIPVTLCLLGRKLTAGQARCGRPIKRRRVPMPEVVAEFSREELHRTTDIAKVVENGCSFRQVV